MKNLSKRSLALVLAMLMMLSMMIVGAVSTNAAEDTIYFVNTENWAKVAAYCYNNVGGNNGNWPGKLATVVDEANGVYSYNAGTYDVIIFNNNNNGKQTANLNTAGNYGKYFEPKTGKFYDSAEAALAAAGSAVNYEYYVAGEEGLCGVNWQASSPSNGMTKGADGTYTKTYTNVAVGTYEYKVTDGTWTNSWGNGSSNAKVKVDVAGSTVVISFVPKNNPTSKVIAPEVPSTTTAPSTTAPSTTAPATDPVATDPVATDPVTTDPVTTDPVATDPVTTEPTGETRIIKFTDNQGWGETGTIYAYFFNADGTVGPAWHGTEMKAFEDNGMGQKNYSVNVPEGATSVIFNVKYSDDTSDQTVDIDFAKDDFEGYYTTGERDELGHLLAYGWDTGEEPATTEPATTEPATTEPATTEPATTEPAADTVTLYCECNQSWWTTDDAAVGVHYWGGSNETKWPGVKGTPVEGEKGLWKFEVPADSTGIIFTRVGNSGDQDGKDWGAQTGNLTIPTDGKNLYTITSETEVWGGNPGVTGVWSVYGAPVETEYTVVYNYTTNEGKQTLTKKVTTDKTDAAAIASLAVPEIVNPYATYALGECKLDGTTVNAAMVATEKEYTVTVDGKEVGKYGYKEKATVTLDGAEYTFYVTGDIELVSGAEKEAAAISLDGLTVSDTQVSMELLATANVDNFDRMGVVFATSEKSQADIEAAVAAVTSGTKVSNGIAVHNSTVDSANESGSYQFTYAPYVSKDKANKTLYFYTFAVDTNGKVSVSSAAKVDLANAVA